MLQPGGKRCSIQSGAGTRVSCISVPVQRVDRGSAAYAARELAVVVLSGFPGVSGMRSDPRASDNNTDSAVRERYSAAARAKEAALCCPVDYDPQYLELIPQESWRTGAN